MTNSHGAGQFQWENYVKFIDEKWRFQIQFAHIFVRSIQMVRLSKQTRDRSVCPRRTKAPSAKTGAKKDALKLGFKEHANALSGNVAQTAFIPKL